MISTERRLRNPSRAATGGNRIRTVRAHRPNRVFRNAALPVAAAAVWLAVGIGHGDDGPSGEALPFGRDVVNRYSLDGVPRSISVRWGGDLWIGYDLERAQAFRVWRASDDETAGRRGVFTVRSEGERLYRDDSKGTWTLRRGEASVPLRTRYLGCSHREDRVVLRWELRHDEGTLVLEESVSTAKPPPGKTPARRLRVEALSEGEAIEPPKPVLGGWRILAGTGEEAAERTGLVGGAWHRLVLR